MGKRMDQDCEGGNICGNSAADVLYYFQTSVCLPGYTWTCTNYIAVLGPGSKDLPQGKGSNVSLPQGLCNLKLPHWMQHTLPYGKF